MHVEVEGLELVLPLRFAPRIRRHAQEVHVIYARHLDGRLKAEEQAGTCALLWLQC